MASKPNLIQAISNFRYGFLANQSKEYISLLRLIVFMVVFGLVMVLSASNVNSIIATGNPFGAVFLQVVWAVLGIIAMFWISNLRVELIESFGRLFFFGSLGAQALVIVPGIGMSSGGNTNWIGFDGFGIQPSEFLKLGLIVYLATLISQRIDQLWDWKAVGQPVMIAGFGSAGLVFVTGRDLGTAAVMLFIVLGIVFLAGFPWQHIMKFVLAMAAVFVIGALLSPSRIIRILTFFTQASDDPDGASWQVRHGIWALASGGITGTGLGQSKLTWGWIPEIENDFIFASIGEEWGFIGALVILGLFFMLFVKLRKMAQSTPDVFVSLVITGIMLWVTLQALINIAVVLHLVPVLGVPLPLISKGGSSLVAILMALGVVLSFERQRSLAPKKRRR
ncbi:MAG: FtsW/RodA/SpoVE family cell cycle protein [Rhodoluna sp.]